ncbi:MAG: beta-CASP ribonuclease aCPSF1 [Candidatus Micrarchaeia archaeon]
MQSLLSEISKKIEQFIPTGCSISKIEAEGPDIILYIDNIEKFYAFDNPVKDIANALKKKVIIRAASNLLMKPEEAKETITKLIQPEAGVNEIRFSPEFHEVWIEAYKPGLVIGKGGSTLKEIIKSTGWAPKVLRTPTLPSEIVKSIRSTMLKEAEVRKKFLLKTGKRIFSNTEKTSWIKITALGGFKEVGRSCIFLETSNDKIVLDAGLKFEATDTAKDFYPYVSTLNIPFDEINAIILSHSHLDHCGFIPYFFAMGYDGPIYCTPPSRDLMALLTFDYIKVMKKQGLTPLYEEKDVRKALLHCITRDFGEVTDISPEIKLTLHNSGHILGSSIVHLHISDGLHNLVYSGDIKFSHTKLLNPAVNTFPRVETLILESTYGGKDDFHHPRPQAEEKVIKITTETLAKGGKVLIPVFSVGRSQDIMLVFEEFARRNPDKANFKVYIDGMILEASAIHTVYPEYLKDSLQRMILSGKSPFESPIFEVVKGNRQEIIEGEPCVILAPSGMMTGGPSVEYFKALAGDPKNAIIFVGFNTNYSLGRKIQKGEKEVAVVGEDGRLETIQVKLRVETAEGFSGHSDRRQLINYIKAMKPKPSLVLINHGEPKKCEEFSNSISRSIGIEARAPMDLDSIRLK